jgi:aminoglycoside phosphotransferase
VAADGRPGLTLEPPEHLKQRFADRAWDMVWSHVPQLQTWRIGAASDGSMFLKLVARDWTPPADAEVTRLRWAMDRLPVPVVLDSGHDTDFDWILTAALRGRNAIDPEVRCEPEVLAGALGRGLRGFHDAPAKDCPFDARNDIVMRRLRDRVDFSEYETLEALRPASEDLVLTHGDACLPNFLIDAWAVTGFVDVGELGLADRWRDIAVALWSLDRNLGPGWGDTFLQAYGIARDERKIEFYGRLYHAV